MTLPAPHDGRMKVQFGTFHSPQPEIGTLTEVDARGFTVLQEKLTFFPWKAVQYVKVLSKK